MKANISRGKLIPPKNLGAALKRRKQLEFEVNRIELQLTERPGTLEWRTSAERALKLFQLEKRLLDEWIDVRQSDSERLLRESYEVMKVLEVEVDFKPHETQLMERLDTFFTQETTDADQQAERTRAAR